MKDFQRTLEDCLTRLSNGTATVDECLARYPEHADELLPLLQTVLLLNRGHDVAPSPTFYAYTHSAVLQYVRSHPRQPRNVMPLFQRAALTFAMLVAALLVTGTAQAQSALPGEAFYTWKLTSEQLWRAISPNTVATDLKITERRLKEWLAVADNPELSDTAMNSYLDALSKLESTDVDSLTLIVPVLQSQQQTLSDAGLSAPGLDDYIVDAANSIPVIVVNQILPTPTHIPPTATDVPPTVVPPSATNIPPTVTDIPPTATNVPPTVTATEVPPTATEIPPTATDVPPTATDVPPTATDVPPPTATDAPPPATDAPESTPTEEFLP